MGKTPLIFIFCLFSVNLSFKLWAGEAIQIANGEWKPYMSESLKNYGVVSHIVSEVFSLQGVKVEYVFLPWQRGLSQAKSGKLAGSIIWSKNDNREKDFYFSDPVITATTRFYHLKNFPFEWTTYTDLMQYQLGALLGSKYVFEPYINTKLSRVKTIEQLFVMLLKGRIDSFVLNTAMAENILLNQFTPQEIAQITWHPLPLNTPKYHLMLSKKLPGNAKIIELFNSDLKLFKDSGNYDQYLADSIQGKYRQ
jgi:polar amino acid transport system substrate-binding protein